MSEIEFSKYRTRGAYHWDQISINPLKRNPFVLGRYKNVMRLAESCYSDGLKGKEVLDVGCGDGVLADMLHRRGANVFGIDSSEIAIDYARTKCGQKPITFDVVDAYCLKWPDEYFDVVVSSDVIEHVRDVDRLMQEMKRVTKVGGFLILSTPIRLTSEPLDKQHVIEWFPSEFRAIVENHFPNSTFYETHPVFWMEMVLRSKKCRFLTNVLSLVKNPFGSLKTRFRYRALQMSVSQRV